MTPKRKPIKKRYSEVSECLRIAAMTRYQIIEVRNMLFGLNGYLNAIDSNAKDLIQKYAKLPPRL